MGHCLRGVGAQCGDACCAGRPPADPEAQEWRDNKQASGRVSKTKQGTMTRALGRLDALGRPSVLTVTNPLHKRAGMVMCAPTLDLLPIVQPLPREQALETARLAGRRLCRPLRQPSRAAQRRLPQWACLALPASLRAR